MLPHSQQKASTRHNCVSRAKPTNTGCRPAAEERKCCLPASKRPPHDTTAKRSHTATLRSRAAPTAASLGCQPLCEPKLAQATTHGRPALGHCDENSQTEASQPSQVHLKSQTLTRYTRKKYKSPARLRPLIWHSRARTWLRHRCLVLLSCLSLLEAGLSGGR